MSAQTLRTHLQKMLDWGDAHADFEAVIANIPAQMQSVRPGELPYSLWQLLEHLRLTQRDILDFCRNPEYQQPAWPDAYWPTSDAPPSTEAWQQSVEAYKSDRQELMAMVADPALDLFAEIKHGEGQTYLREILLVADHTSYHLGEMVAVRRLLRIWK